MATNLPIPRPPRTPTPPPDNPPDEADLPPRLSYNPNGLFPEAHTGLYPRELANSQAWSPTRATFNSVSPGYMQSGSGENGTGPFNFKPTVLSKSPVMKSVCEDGMQLRSPLTDMFRTLARGEVTSTSIVVFRIRSFWSRLPEPPWPCQIRFLFRRQKNIEPACLKSKTPGFGGASVICSLLGIRSGPPTALWQ
jgi:hypothetical protein